MCGNAISFIRGSVGGLPSKLFRILITLVWQGIHIFFFPFVTLKIRFRGLESWIFADFGIRNLHFLKKASSHLSCNLEDCNICTVC